MIINMDPVFFLHLILVDFFPQKTAHFLPLTHPYMLAFRFFFQFPMLLNGFRTMIFLFLSFVFELKLERSHINQLAKSPTSIHKFYSDFSQKLKFYRMLYIFVRTIDTPVVSPIAATLMAIALTLEILAVFVTLRMFKLAAISLSTLLIYSFWPCLALLVIVIAGLEIPDAASVYEETRSIIQKWKKHPILQLRGKRYFNKYLKTVRPVQITAGYRGFPFFHFKQSTKLSFYGILIYYVITSLLSAPPEHISQALDTVQAQIT